MNYLKRLNRAGNKLMIHYEYGRGKGQRPATGMFLYTNLKNQAERNHNKETNSLMDIKKGQQIIEVQAVGTGYIPTHKLEPNFIKYYEKYVKDHKREGNRHLSCCFTKLKKFTKTSFLSPLSVTYDFCFLFRRYLLDSLTGETPQNYYATFKNVIQSATRDGYFRIDPTLDIAAVRKPNTKLKDFLEVDEYLAVIQRPAPPHISETIEGFIFRLYTGLRWCNVEPLAWEDIADGNLTTRIIQIKTGYPVILTLHPVALQILKKQRVRRSGNCTGRVFTLPLLEAANLRVANPTLLDLQPNEDPHKNRWRCVCCRSADGGIFCVG